MHRIDAPDATSDHRFTEGNPTIPIPATTVTADWLNAVQEEIVAVLAAAKAVPDKADNTQLADAITGLIASNAAAPQHGHSAADITTGTLPAARGGTGRTDGKAAALVTARTIDGVSFDGTANCTHYVTCSTAAATAAKVVTLAGYVLATGARVAVRFTVTNTAANPTLNISDTGAKAIHYHNAAISAGVLAANRTYEFVYDGSTYQLVGDVLQVGAGLALSAAGVATVRYGTAANTACQGNDARLASGEAFRQAMIGSPVYLPTTTLPTGFMWADGSLAKFADWPELQAKYNAGGFAGMLLAYNASEEDIAAYPGKFKPDAANPTGLFVPRLTGLFARCCAGEGAGRYNAASLPNIKGLLHGVRRIDQITNEEATSTLYWQSRANVMTATKTAEGSVPGEIGFDASRSSGIYGSSSTVMPPSANLPVALYLGRPAQV